jgi:phosphoribosylformylglycinamidine cyclo-ligase
LGNWPLQTEEMPGFYAEGEYDLSVFAVGAVKKDNVIDGKNIIEEKRLL